MKPLPVRMFDGNWDAYQRANRIMSQIMQRPPLQPTLNLDTQEVSDGVETWVKKPFEYLNKNHDGKEVRVASCSDNNSPQRDLNIIYPHSSMRNMTFKMERK